MRLSHTIPAATGRAVGLYVARATIGFLCLLGMLRLLEGVAGAQGPAKTSHLRRFALIASSNRSEYIIN